MTAEAFIAQMEASAVAYGARCDILPSVALAQWCDETGFGSSPYWTGGHNPAGISWDGLVKGYPSVEAGLDDWVSVMRSSYYDAVRGARGAGAVAQATALGRSPWASSHYAAGGGAPGTDLVSIISDYGLTRYDQPQPVKPQPVPSLGGGDMLGTNDPDAGRVRAFIRWAWGVFHTDGLTAEDQDLGVLAYYSPVADRGFGGSPDLLLAWIIDTAKPSHARLPGAN